MSDDSRALGPGLKASASPFVPKVEAAAGSSVRGSSDSSSQAVAAVNGASSADRVSSADEASTAAAAAAAAVAAVAAGKAAKAGSAAPKQPLSPVTSKLSSAAASAAPFVPGKAGKMSTSAMAAAAAAAATAAVAAVQAPAAAKSKQQQVRGGKQPQQPQQLGRQQHQQKQQKDAKEEGKEQRQQQDDKKDAAGKALVGKMSAAAAAFVPKAPGSAAAAPPPPAAPGGSSSGGSQQQQARPPSAGSSAAAARLRSPLKGSNTPAAAAATPSPARGSASRAGRQGSRGDTPSSARSGGQGSGPGGMYGGGFGGRGLQGLGGGMQGLGGGMQGLGGGMQGLGGGGAGGPKRALLAQFQGNYQQYSAGGMGYGGFHPSSFHHHHHHHHHQGGGKQQLSGQFISEGLRQQLQQANYLIQLQHTPSADEAVLPDKIGPYHTLYPLEDVAAADAAGSSISAAWGVRTSVLKGISARDGKAYALRVVCGKQVIPSLEMLSVVRQAVEAWSCLAGHPGLLVPLEGLVSSELDGSPSLVVVQHYIPGAVILAQAHLQPAQTVSGLVHNTPSEELLWSYTVQLAAILRAAHSVGLALRPPALSATKVLLTPVGRLKVSGLGVAEALTGEVVPASSDDLLQLQRDDVVAMGQLLLQLACAVGSLPAPSLDFASAHYSPEFVRLLVLLLGVAEGAAFSWRAVSALLGERLLLEMDSLAGFNEQLLEELSREMENGRLFRLVSKLSFVTDRPNDGAAASGALGGWADTGDRYLLQLFRDFVFHQGELDGGRVLDWGHVIESLNKLDAGVAEQVLLQSRDERSLLVVSYADIKRCIETAIAEIRTRAGGAAGGHGLHPLQGGPGGGGGGLMRAHGATMFGGMGR